MRKAVRNNPRYSAVVAYSELQEPSRYNIYVVDPNGYERLLEAVQGTLEEIQDYLGWWSRYFSA